MLLVLTFESLGFLAHIGLGCSLDISSMVNLLRQFYHVAMKGEEGG